MLSFYPRAHSGAGLDGGLSRDALHALCTLPCVLRFTESSDYLFYQALVEVLIPDVLRPIPVVVEASLRRRTLQVAPLENELFCGDKCISVVE